MAAPYPGKHGQTGSAFFSLEHFYIAYCTST